MDVQLLGRVCLEDVLGHSIEDMEKRLQLKLGQVRRLERRWLHVVAQRECVLRLTRAWAIGPWRGEGSI